MPIHIYGSGGGGGGKNALSVYFTPTDAYAHTFTIDDVDFAQRFNEAKTTKHLDLFFEGDFISAPNTNDYAVYHVSKGVVNGDDAQRMIGVKTPNAIQGDGSAMLWDGGFTISGNSATFSISLVSGMAFSQNSKYRATWICEE